MLLKKYVPIYISILDSEKMEVLYLNTPRLLSSPSLFLLVSLYFSLSLFLSFSLI